MVRLADQLFNRLKALFQTVTNGGLVRLGRLQALFLLYQFSLEFANDMKRLLELTQLPSFCFGQAQDRSWGEFKRFYTLLENLQRRNGTEAAASESCQHDPKFQRLQQQVNGVLGYLLPRADHALVPPPD